MEGRRRRSESEPPTHPQSKKIKTTHPIETGEIPNLPPEIIIEIVTRLPVKSIFKCRCVSKSWFSLISSAQFIKSHLNYSTQNPNFTNHRIVFTLSFPQYNLKHCAAPSLLSEHAIVASETDYPRKSPHSAVWTVGSCNGIICLAIDEKDIYLWNPTTKTSKKLPQLTVEMKKGFYYIWGFGFNEFDNDYKVVGIFCLYGNGGVYESIVKIYSMKANSWKRIGDFNSGIPLDDSGKYASGKLHFAASPGIDSGFRWNIISLDLKREEYGRVEQPNYGEGCYESSLGVLGGCICVVRNYQKVRADVWVLKEYGVGESWAKVVSVPYVGDPGLDLYSSPLVVMPSGEVLLVFGGNSLVVYNPNDNSLRRPEVSNVGLFLETGIYVESLVSLCVGD